MSNLIQLIKYGLLGFFFALMIHTLPLHGCSKDEDPEEDEPIENQHTLDLNKADDTAEEVEKAFESGDVSLILPYLSEQAIVRSKEDLENASTEMLKQFAIDFNDREIAGFGDEFIEYEFDWGGIPYTVDFAIQEDGSIKIIRL
jgi:hypothetical protein